MLKTAETRTEHKPNGPDLGIDIPISHGPELMHAQDEGSSSRMSRTIPRFAVDAWKQLKRLHA